MVRILRRRRRALLELDERDREVAASWVVVLLAAAAGLSFLSVQQFAAESCPTTLALPGVVHRPYAGGVDWEDPACSAVRCGRTLSASERDAENDEPDAGDSGSTAANADNRRPRPDTVGNARATQDEPLCS